MLEIITFVGWSDLFRREQEDTGVDCSLIRDYRFQAKFDFLHHKRYGH